MTLYGALVKANCDKDITDSIFDFYNCYCINEDKDIADDYDRCINKMAHLIKVEKEWDDCIVCNITEFIFKHLDAFKKFTNEENREGYRAKDIGDYKTIDDVNDDFYDVYLETFRCLINGNYCDSDYKKLYELLTK